MKLLLRNTDAEDRRLVEANLQTDWEIEVWQTADGEDAYAAALDQADAVVAMNWTASTPPASRLKLLQLPGAGYDSIDFAAVPAQSTVCNVFEHEIGIAEYAILAMLSSEIDICRIDANLRRGSWQDGLFGGGGLHGELYGKTLGIVGYGRIGRETARRARALGVRIVACTRSPDKYDDNVEWIAGIGELDRLLGESDYVLIACPLTPQTEGLIAAGQFDAMKANAVIINVARGRVIDEEALYRACRDRQIAGAVIDTWYIYPKDTQTTTFPASQPFHELDNVTMTPHLSGQSAGLWRRRWAVMAGNLNRLARGEPLQNIVRAAGGPAPE